MKGLRLIATGGALPGRTVTNEELSRTVDTSDEWITTRTGIRTRHYCTEGENAATLAIAAAKQALQRSGLAPADIACCVCATLSAPDATPSVACQVLAALALPENRPALDVNAACSGFLYGTAVARGLLATLGVSDTMGVMIKALPFNFYCIIALVVCLVVIFKNWNIGGMKEAENAIAVTADDAEQAQDTKTATPWLVVLPILVIIACVIGGQLITGKGTFADGDTSTSVFYAMLIGNVVTIIMCMIFAGMKYGEAVKACGQGILEMIPVAMLLVFAFCLSGICGELNIGAFISGITAAHIPNAIVPTLVFVTGALMAFATGSSWGTFAIMIPIVVPMAAASVIPMNILVAAMLSGAIMGDHCSMISDSTVMASAFSGCDNVKHFRTQLPYALISAGAAAVLYLITGFVM